MPINKWLRSIVLCLCLLTQNNLFAERIKDLYPHAGDDQIKSLLVGEYWEANSYVAEKPVCLLTSSLFTEIKNYEKEKNPELFLEMVKLIPGKNYNNKEKLLEALNSLAAVSEQEGLEYVSFNRGNKLYPLITRSYYVESDNKKKKENIIFSHLDTDQTFRVYQRDTTFGGNMYKYRYTGSDKGFRLAITNIETLSVKGLFKVAEPEEVSIYLVFIPVEEGLLCYTLAFIQNPPKVKEVMGYKVNVVGSYRKRLKVIMDWYSNKLLF